MPFGRKRSPATGPDYLLSMAEDAARAGKPYAQQFGLMVYKALRPDEDVPLVADAVAKRPLKDYEASPVAIVLAALEAAQSAHDDESAAEVARVGATLLAKWPEFLAVTSGHPYFSESDRT